MNAKNRVALSLVAASALSLCAFAFGAAPVPDLSQYRQQVVEMFYHAYDGYMKHGFPLDELRPLSCDGIDTWGSYSLTLIDALDTLAILGNHSEFRRVADLLISSRKNFEANINVSVFETNIRIVGGLISAHLFARRAGMDLDPGWPCKGPLLDLAVDIARRLLPAFDTPTGMPFGTINLAHGVPKGETPVTCTAGVGTYIVEFSALSRLTGDPIFEDVAMRAMNGLWSRRSSIGLFGNHIDVSTGKWTAIESGIGAGVDSYLEYMVKGGILRRDPVLLEMFDYARKPIRDYLEHGGWHFWGTMSRGAITMPVFQSLEAYWPGVLSLIGDIGSAMASLKNYRLVWKQFGFTPEFYSVPTQEVGSRHGYPLRPELAESVMYLYRATRDPFVLDMGVDILASIEHSAKTACGYATVKNVLTHQLEDRMESFFLAETVKYLYLLFTPDHWIHNPGGSGVRVSVESDFGDSRTCVVESGGFIFNTEAHPVDVAALDCCMESRQERSLKDRARYSVLGLDTRELRKFRGDKRPEEKKQPREKARLIPLPEQPAAMPSNSPSSSNESSTSTTATSESSSDSSPPQMESRYWGSPQWTRPTVNPFYDFFMKTLAYTGYKQAVKKFDEAEFLARVKESLREETGNVTGLDYSWLTCYALPFGAKFGSYTKT